LGEKRYSIYLAIIEGKTYPMFGGERLLFKEKGLVVKGKEFLLTISKTFGLRGGEKTRLIRSAEKSCD